MVTPSQDTDVSLFLEKYCITLRWRLVRSVAFPERSPLILLFSLCLGTNMSAKRTYAEVVSGIDNTPDYGQRWMQAYQKESEEDALLRVFLVTFFRC